MHNIPTEPPEEGKGDPSGIDRPTPDNGPHEGSGEGTPTEGPGINE